MKIHGDADKTSSWASRIAGQTRDIKEDCLEFWSRRETSQAKRAN